LVGLKNSLEIIKNQVFTDLNADEIEELKSFMLSVEVF